MAQDTMIETKEQAAEFLQRLSKDRQPEQFPDLIFGVLRALKQDMQRDEAQPDCDKTENMLRYSERAALTALCCCCNETGMGGGSHFPDWGDAGSRSLNGYPAVGCAGAKGFFDPPASGE